MTRLGAVSSALSKDKGTRDNDKRGNEEEVEKDFKSKNDREREREREKERCWTSEGFAGVLKLSRRVSLSFSSLMRLRLAGHPCLVSACFLAYMPVRIIIHFERKLLGALCVYPSLWLACALFYFFF